jgi:hypothetical protein
VRIVEKPMIAPGLSSRPFGQRALDGHVDECGRTDDGIEGLGRQVVEFAGIRLKQLDVPMAVAPEGHGKFLQLLS